MDLRKLVGHRTLMQCGASIIIVNEKGRLIRPMPSILLELLSEPTYSPKSGLFAANVTFEPGCRNNWHIHHAKSGGGQLLICIAGEGWYQEEGKDAVSLQEEMSWDLLNYRRKL